MARINDIFHLDPSPAEDGYVTVDYTGPRLLRYQVEVKCGGNVKQYNMPDRYLNIPLNMGKGQYVFTLIERINEKRSKRLATIVHKFEAN